MKGNLKWIVVFGAVCALCVALRILWGNMAQGKVAVISLDGDVVEKINLDEVEEDYEFEIDDGDGGSNTVRVEKGRIAVVEANCPDKVCVNTGYIENGAEMIVCLPHKLSITIEGAEDEIDAVAGGG